MGWAQVGFLRIPWPFPEGRVLQASLQLTQGLCNHSSWPVTSSPLQLNLWDSTASLHEFGFQVLDF